MNHIPSRYLALLFLPVVYLCVITGCSHHPKTVIPAFYYWKTKLELNDNEKQLLNATGSKLLFVRFFDVGPSWDETYFPVSPEGKIEFKQQVPANTQVIPVVYITNKALEKLDSNDIDEFAARIRRKVDRMCKKNNIATPKEYQLDCDWNNKTRDRYFKLVSAYKQQIAPARVSVTIRLHQYKYAAKTGTPPADRGMLMMYNMGHLQDESKENYILDIDEAKKYLDKKGGYALPLDIALPVYAQGVCYNGLRNSSDVTLMQAEEVEEDIANGWLIPTKDNWYEENKGKEHTSPHYYSPSRLIKIRYEQITPAKLMQATALVQGIAAHDTCRIVFFHLDSFQCRKFTADDFNKVVHNL